MANIGSPVACRTCATEAHGPGAVLLGWAFGTDADMAIGVPPVRRSAAGRVIPEADSRTGEIGG